MPVSCNADEVVDSDEEKSERVIEHSLDIPSAAYKQCAFSWSSGDTAAAILTKSTFRSV